MNGVLLDTSAYSDMARGNSDVLDAIQTADTISVNSIILGELFSGFTQGNQEPQNLKVLEKFLDSPRCVVLPIIKETAKRYAHIINALRKAGTPIPTNDAWIAATAMEHGLTVVTTDTHFNRIPQILCRLCTS
ncbi:MAG: type II toxin-antitoxin system VapC family toxin [Chitinispirillaceae bacterium]|nr:type II toxin-antitoxin system VapC family toxin [Chitinispirillaceae bacterium]